MHKFARRPHCCCSPAARRCVRSLSPAIAAERPAARGDDHVALRIRFGMKDKEATDWSGKLALSDGKVEAIRGWRWMAGDDAPRAMRSPSPRAASSRRTPPSGKRVQAGEQMPMSDNGIVVTLAGTTENSDGHLRRQARARPSSSSPTCRTASR